jgi:hypothetical protein
MVGSAAYPEEAYSFDAFDSRRFILSAAPSDETALSITFAPHPGSLVIQHLTSSPLAPPIPDLRWHLVHSHPSSPPFQHALRIPEDRRKDLGFSTT